MSRMTNVFAVIVLVLIGLHCEAQAQGTGVLIGRNAIGLTKADLERMGQAVRTVLESGQVGAVETWDNPDSGSAGTATLVQTFELEGMPCGKVEHVYTAGKGKGQVLTAPLCKVADGSWKFAF